MSETPNIFEDLRRIGVLKRERLGGRPSDNALSKIPQSPGSRDTIGAWLRGERFPQRLEALLAVLREIRTEAVRILDTPADAECGETVAELLAEDRWRRTWMGEQRRRTQVNQQSAERQRARQALLDEERRARQAALADRARPIRSWTPQRLGVHPAISGHLVMPDVADFVLPPYVKRPHDDRLRARLKKAVADSASLLVVVRGQSCTGKTRTAVEALTVLPNDFQLLFPTDADSLLAILAADALGPGTVLWLNEAQHYLDGPVGEAAAAGLLRRLDADGPFIALATLWPDHDKKFTTASSSSNNDPHKQARSLLAQAHYIHLPDAFTEHLDAVRQVATDDPSLTAALEAGGTRITQTLAAGPDLVAHYERPDGKHGIYGKALISVAMDAHRFGVTAPLSLAFLRDAAPGYLTDSERGSADPDTWFDGALTHARTIIKKTTQPLQDVPRPSGMGALPDVVALADYLQQHGRHTRQRCCPPSSFWDAASQHLTSEIELSRLGNAARRRYRLRHAGHLFCAAINAGGSRVAWAWLSETAELAGYWREAERFARRGSYADSLRRLVWMREEKGDLEGAERLLRLANVHFDRGWLTSQLALMRDKAGDADEAERLALEAATLKPRPAMYGLEWLASRRDEAGNQEDAERLIALAADAGEHWAVVRLGIKRIDTGDWEGAQRLMHLLEGWMERHALQDKREKAEEAIKTPVQLALWDLARDREKAGNRGEAERLYRTAANAGDLDAVTWLTWAREQTGDRYGAERLVQQTAGADGWSYPMWDLALRWEEAGHRERAETLARQSLQLLAAAEAWWHPEVSARRTSFPIFCFQGLSGVERTIPPSWRVWRHELQLWLPQWRLQRELLPR
ncbi:tetratricopeptide repeat protein [Streptomyces sp. NRRL S-646]|uniref:tetratricopeptide repeat protein n=1 Tax=Streptomyces sp. NRRL S-646 TaxID=1463917 RepID=UPI001331875B|nr:tetratricopeptide repeat protein [Streptomyces sp. NRRL S-646]